MISINNVTVSYGDYDLLDNISFHISDNDKVGLTGKNGCGKSTIMKLICDIQSPTSGSIDRPTNVRIGYLPQVMKHNKGKTVIDEAMTVFSKLKEKKEELDKITLELSERTDYESKAYLDLINRMNDLNDYLSVNAGEPPLVKTEKTLLGLGFKTEDFNRKTETFSQGWNMRIELAKILLDSPDVLLLDEPTNHLDIESIEWLEDYLKNFNGSFLLVSHDRKFLDNVTNRTVEIMLGHIHDYKVPYTQYLELRKERIKQQRAAYANQQKTIEKTEEFIRKFRYQATKSNQVQSRIKALEKMEKIEVDIVDRATLSMNFPPAPRSGDMVFKSQEMTVGYPGKVVFRDANVEVARGEKVAFIGRNGEGKTTLMRVIMNELQPISGEAKLGYNVEIGYYAQNQEDVLDKNKTVYETLDDIAVGDIRTKLRDILAEFLFKEEDIDKKVSVLSGGERARLGIAKLMLQPYNLLAMDEPTNHMDIQSKDILKQALKSYDGTVIIVSHDRDFLEGLVDKMYEFRDGKVREHLGTVSDFLYRRKIENLQELERRFSSNDTSKSTTSSSNSTTKIIAAAGNSDAKAETLSKEEAKRRFEIQKQKNKDEKRIKNKISSIEKEIAKLEEEMEQIEKKLMDPGEGDDIMALSNDYQVLKEKTDKKTDEWSELLEQIS